MSYSDTILYHILFYLSLWENKTKKSYLYSLDLYYKAVGIIII